MFVKHASSDALVSVFDDWCRAGSRGEHDLADETPIPVATLMTQKLEPWLEEVDAFRAYFGQEPRDWDAPAANDIEERPRANDAAVGFPE